MARNYNVTQVGGHLVADPTTTQSSNGAVFTHMRVAVNRIPTKNNKNPGTDYINLTLVGHEGAHAADHLRKGSPIIAMGRLQSRDYTDKNGQKRYEYSVFADYADQWDGNCVNINDVTMRGRLTADPIYTAGDGNKPSRVMFTVAMDRDVAADADGNRASEFIPVKAFGYSADFTHKYLKKGMSAFIRNGRIETSSYVKDGQTVYSTAVLAGNIEFGEKKKDNSTNTQQSPQGNYAQNGGFAQNSQPEQFPNVQGGFAQGGQSGQFPGGQGDPFGGFNQGTQTEQFQDGFAQNNQQGQFPNAQGSFAQDNGFAQASQFGGSAPAAQTEQFQGGFVQNNPFGGFTQESQPEQFSNNQNNPFSGGFGTFDLDGDLPFGK